MATCVGRGRAVGAAQGWPGVGGARMRAVGDRRDSQTVFRAVRSLPLGPCCSLCAVDAVWAESAFRAFARCDTATHGDSPSGTGTVYLKQPTHPPPFSLLIIIAYCWLPTLCCHTLNVAPNLSIPIKYNPSNLQRVWSLIIYIFAFTWFYTYLPQF